MSRADDKRKAQEEFTRALEQDANQRPNIPPERLSDIPPHERCIRGRHNVSMRGSDGKMRCWKCCKTREQIEAAKQ